MPLSPSITGLNEGTGRYSPGGDVDHLKRPCRCAASSCAVQRRLSRDIDPSGRRRVGRLEPVAGVSTASCAGCLARHRNFPNVFSSSNRRGPSSGNGLPPQIHVTGHHCARLIVRCIAREVPFVMGSLQTVCAAWRAQCTHAISVSFLVSQALIRGGAPTNKTKNQRPRGVHERGDLRGCGRGHFLLGGPPRTRRKAGRLPRYSTRVGGR